MQHRTGGLGVIHVSSNIQKLSCTWIGCIDHGMVQIFLSPIKQFYLILFEICSNSPPLVIGEGVSVLLKQGVDTRDSTVPRVLQIFQGQTPEERTNKIFTAKTSYSWQF